MLAQEIERLEASLDAPPTAEGEAIAAAIVDSLLTVPPEAALTDRTRAVRGLLALSQHYYRLGDLALAGSTLAAADAISKDFEATPRVNVLVRRGEFELLIWDVAGALDHTSEALPIAQRAGLRLEEARIWTNYATALQAAGLARQAEERFVHALELLEGLEEPRLRSNIWALRSQLGFHADDESVRRALKACELSLLYAEQAPARARDAMVSTAYCNLAAIAIVTDDLDRAAECLDKASALPNLGKRPRWLIGVLAALRAVRIRNRPDERATLAALLTPERAPARVYIIETYLVMAAMYAAMGDAEHANEALVRHSRERAQALLATLADPGALDARPGADGRSRARGAVASLGMMERFAITAELRDDATGRHCYRVGRLARLIALRAGLTERQAEAIDHAARLHDIGKFAIPDAILLKPGPLDESEMKLMRTHTTLGSELLDGHAVELDGSAERVARGHHEHWDGRGYPEGRVGEDIPLVARLAAIADVYDALSHERPYKRAWSHDESVEYIRGMRGTQFDPRLTDLFLELMAEVSRDVAGFCASQEAAGAESPWVLAEARVSEALK